LAISFRVLLLTSDPEAQAPAAASEVPVLDVVLIDEAAIRAGIDP